MATRTLHLLIIDPQNDFCDLPTNYCPTDSQGRGFAPSLPVTGAHTDMQRLASTIDAGRVGLSAITVTLDSHQHLDIAHPTFWQDVSGAPIAPFTQIQAADVRAGRFLPRNAKARDRAQSYLDALESAGRYTHMVWPVHCEIGTWGHNIHHDLRLACNRWEESNNGIVAKVSKGENPWTEHYSAMMAEVPDQDDAHTQLNAQLLQNLRAADQVFIAGEAGSHCVKATTEHIVANWPAAELSRLVLIEDCISAVSGFEPQYADFLADMRRRGVQVMSAADVCAELQGNIG